MKRAVVASLSLAATLLVVTACGDKKPKGKSSGVRLGEVEQAFVDASRATGIPVRYLMAVGFLESRLSSAPASSLYVNPENPETAVRRGTGLAQTAFGVSFAALQLDPLDPASLQLPTQVRAYADWLAAETTSLNLSPSPANATDKYFWLSTIAQKHREGRTQRRNVRIIFAKDLVEVLNEGFIWQDEETGERLTLAKEDPPFSIDQLDVDGQQWFELDERPSSDIGTAIYYPLVSVPSNGNNPKRVEVIHCPLSLSACLEIQSQPQGEDIRLSAHYVIAPDRSIVNLPMQVARHSHVITITNSQGEEIPIQDAIVVMLVGQSGRVAEGIRNPAIPTWFSDMQLRDMGNVINDVCNKLAQDNPAEVNYDACMKVGDSGVTFRYRGAREPLRWGEIPDFDANIFFAYVERPGGVESGVAFNFPGDRRTYASNEEIPLKVLFQPIAQRVSLERLARCENNHVVWEKIDDAQVRGQTFKQFTKRIFDAGPNGNGEQFFRARVYDNAGLLVGWSIDRIYLAGFEKENIASASPDTCRFVD